MKMQEYGGILIILKQEKDNYILAWKLSTFSKRRVRGGRVHCQFHQVQLIVEIKQK